MNDLEQIEKEWLTQCGPHDFGLVEYGCNCAKGDYRWVMSQLVAEIRMRRNNEVCPHDCDYCHGDDCPCDRLGCAGHGR